MSVLLGCKFSAVGQSRRFVSPLTASGLPQLRTSHLGTTSSEKCQKQTHAPQQGDLFDHLVGAGKKGVRNFKAKRP